MRFSIRTLLALIVLAAVTANLFRSIYANRRVNLEILDLHAASDARDLDSYDSRVLAHERYLIAEAKRQSEFETAAPAFEKLSQKYCALEVSDPSRLTILDCPRARRSPRDINKRWMLHVPEQDEWQLAIDFPDSDSATYAQWWDPGDSKRIDLVGGKTKTIDFEWNDQELTATVSVNGEVVNRQVVREGAARSGTSSTHFRTPHAVHPRQPQLALFSISVRANATNQEAVEISLVRRKESK